LHLYRSLAFCLFKNRFEAGVQLLDVSSRADKGEGDGGRQDEVGGQHGRGVQALRVQEGLKYGKVKIKENSAWKMKEMKEMKEKCIAIMMKTHCFVHQYQIGTMY
jgi:hypothetical protein